MGSSSISASQATPPLLRLANRILQPAAGQTLVVADSDHFTAQIVDSCKTETPFDLLVPMDNTRSRLKQMRAIPPETFVRGWAGFATAKLPYQMKRTGTGPHWLYVQRSGETEQDAQFCGFLCTRDRQEVDGLTADYPKRWHVEEFFNAHQALGWQRAGTMNLNIRYGQMTTALIAQAVIHQFRERMSR